ncbi:ABC transporter ATP-binding protein [Streptomyces sp. TLI_146]|uniref:dipeptide ABC transporter ATP-binding protein n=1 Tax=Streptomyces sp. TLI_146 TaxID=1938858 RepID=UPI000C70D94E|nr:ABC transporter ATP-binding protein [Streptomyces sp. TLI_146]PKV87704.1 peptide/nickel transport system ATP-binding protein [Streptomyces sp. TLI_146]
MTEATTEALVEVADLGISFGETRAVDGLSFSLAPGAALGVVGESGSGKSASAYALLGLHRGTGAVVDGTVRVAGTDVQRASDAELRRLRGGVAAMVFQDPLSSLDPYYAIGDQIAEVYRVHRGGSKRAARARAVEVLDRVGIPDAARKARSRPHEFSGGMRQRALIAMALACEPKLLIADEPTTALDVTVQAQILDLLHGLRQETGMGLLLVTHDVGVAAESVDDVLVMRQGRAVERGPVRDVLGAPKAAYTKELLSAVPRLDTVKTAAPDAGEPLLEARDLLKVFGRGKSSFTAVDGVSLTVRRGETLGVVGESGSGKTTLGRMLVGLLDTTSGTIRRDGTAVQMVFQDPVASLNPRRSIGESVADPLRASGVRDDNRIRARVGELLERVGLDPDRYDRYPHEFSGGQRQRVGIARALAAEPQLIVCDEPVSALDVTTQAHVTELLAELQRELGLGLVFIAHDLAVVRQVSDRVAVMRRGRIVEEGAVDEVYASPKDPYTRQLLAAVPTVDPVLAAVRRAARKELREQLREQNRDEVAAA